MAEERRRIFEGMTDVGQAEELLNRYRCDYPDNIDGAEELLNELMNALVQTGEQMTGSADDFHNMAVSISRIKGENRDALTIIREGLKIHEANTDLLADAIRYGYNCGEKEACAQWYQKLCGIDKKKWTWRAFSFSFDYLMAVQDSDSEENIDSETILELVKEYQEMQPDQEDAWLCEYEFYSASNQRKEAIEVLDKAIQRFEFCPKCWLRYAEFMITEGKYEKAEPIIKKLRRNPRTSESVNLSYVFYLDGECKLQKLLALDGFEDGEFDERDVMKIYKDFQLALTTPGLRQNTKSSIRTHVERLVNETEISNPYFNI